MFCDFSTSLLFSYNIVLEKFFVFGSPKHNIGNRLFFFGGGMRASWPGKFWHFDVFHFWQLSALMLDKLEMKPSHHFNFHIFCCVKWRKHKGVWNFAKIIECDIFAYSFCETRQQHSHQQSDKVLSSRTHRVEWENNFFIAFPTPSIIMFHKTSVIKNTWDTLNSFTLIFWQCCCCFVWVWLWFHRHSVLMFDVVSCLIIWA